MFKRNEHGNKNQHQNTKQTLKTFIIQNTYTHDKE